MRFTSGFWIFILWNHNHSGCEWAWCIYAKRANGKDRSIFSWEDCGEIRRGCATASDRPQEWLSIVLRCLNQPPQQSNKSTKTFRQWWYHHVITSSQWNGVRAQWRTTCLTYSVTLETNLNCLLLCKLRSCSINTMQLLHTGWRVFIYNTCRSATASCRIGTLGICETTRLDWWQDQSGGTTVR